MNLDHDYHSNFIQSEAVFCECNIKRHFVHNKKCILNLRPEIYMNHKVNTMNVDIIDSKWVFRILKLRYINKI